MLLMNSIGDKPTITGETDNRATGMYMQMK